MLFIQQPKRQYHDNHSDEKDQPDGIALSDPQHKPAGEWILLIRRMPDPSMCGQGIKEFCYDQHGSRDVNQ